MTQSFDDWLKHNPPPDLEALAAKYGGLGNVPPEAWAEFQRQREEWQIRYRDRPGGQS